jgi:hypothetical protein
MPAPHAAKLGRVRVASTLEGTYATVGFTRSVDFTRGSEGSTLLRWLGGQSLRPGDRTLGFSFPIFWDNTDTTGQTILETAWANGTTVGIQICPEGTGVGKRVFQFEGSVDEAPISFDSEGEAVESTFSGTGSPTTYTVETLE